MIDPAHPSAVVKVGGSLLDWPDLPGRLAEFLASGLGHSNRLVLIAGGGRMVDAVRDLDRVHRLGDAEAHWLAIDALDLTARVLGRLLPGARVIADDDGVRACWEAGLTPVLAPGLVLRKPGPGRGAPLPATWDATSDSIAAWIAARLGADRLVLLKSRHLTRGVSRSRAAAEGLVDPLFAAVARPLGRVDYRNLRDPGGGLIELPGQD
jgi:aspartokinase-like uncharacterized kinase